MVALEQKGPGKDLVKEVPSEPCDSKLTRAHICRETSSATKPALTLENSLLLLMFNYFL